jgi:hypothetical protein
MEKAYEALRKKGLAAAAKKADRHASEGLVGCMSIANGRGAGNYNVSFLDSYLLCCNTQCVLLHATVTDV